MSGKSITFFAQTFLFATLLQTAAVTSSTAGDTRGYIPAPPDSLGALFYYYHSAGHEKYKNGNKVADDYNLLSNMAILRPVYYSALASMPVSVQALIPFGDISLDGTSVGNKSYSSSGLADPTILVGIWPISNPQTKTWLGITEWVKFPLGEYDKGRALNMGANQWAFKTEVGFIQGWGDFYLELTPWVEFYTDNGDYTAAGKTLAKDPVFGLETHLSYDLTKSVLVSLDHYFKKGGETTVASVAQNDETNTQSLQFTLGFKPAPKQQLLLQYLQDVSVENGPKTSRIGIRYTFMF